MYVQSLIAEKGRVESRFHPALPHQTVRAVLPHTAFRCSSPSDMRLLLLLPTSCCRHFIQSVSLIQYPAAKPLVPCKSVSDFMTLAQVCPQSFFCMGLHACKGLEAVAIVKVTSPSSKGGV